MRQRKIGHHHPLLLHSACQRIQRKVQRLLVLKRRSQRNIGFHLGFVALFHLHARGKRGLIDVAQRRKIVVGHPIPQANLLAQEHRLRVEHLENGLQFIVGLHIREVPHDANVVLRLTERHQHAHAASHPLRPFFGQRIGEKAIQRQGKNNFYIFHCRAKVVKNIKRWHYAANENFASSQSRNRCLLPQEQRLGTTHFSPPMVCGRNRNR